MTDNYDVTRVLIFEHNTSKTRFALVFGFSFRFPQETLGMVRVLELNSDIPDWLQNWESETDFNETEIAYRNWLEDEVEDWSGTVFFLEIKGLLRGIRATLRKGHIMGVPFFVSNVRILTDRTATKVLDEDST